MLIEVKEGDIFNQATLSKIKYVSEELLKIPGVDRYKTLSLSQKKMKDFRITSWGFASFPLIGSSFLIMLSRSDFGSFIKYATSSILYKFKRGRTSSLTAFIFSVCFCLLANLCLIAAEEDSFIASF